jgi:hypothetical protein
VELIGTICSSSDTLEGGRLDTSGKNLSGFEYTISTMASFNPWNPSIDSVPETIKTCSRQSISITGVIFINVL